MGIQINGSTDRITAIDGTIDFVSNIGNIGLITASRYELLDSITIGAGSTIIKTSNGKLGIGTVTPGALLDVQHHAGSGGQSIIRNKATQANASTFVRAEDSGSTYIGLLKYGTGHSAYGALGAGDGALYANSGGGNDTNITIMADSSTGYINFATGGNAEKLRINSTGKVRVGSGSATYNLEVQTTGFVETMIGSTNAGGAGIILDGDSNGDGAGGDYAQIFHQTDGTLNFRARNGSGGTDTIFLSGTSERLRITSGGNVIINEAPPWSVAGGDYRNLSISGQVANSGGFLWLGNGTATTNGDFDLGRINFCNGATITSQIAGSTQTSANDDGRITFHTKATGGSLTEKVRITSAGIIQCGTSGVLKAEINNAVSGHQFISQCSDNNTGFEIYQQHGTTASRNTLGVYDNRTGSKKPTFVVRGDGHLILDTTSNGYGGLKIYDDSGGDYNVRYVAGRNQGATSHVFMRSGRTQNQSPWADATPVEHARITHGGIAFGGDTAASNTLDDYEHGSLSLTMTASGGGSISTGYNQGYYVKIGNVVHVVGDLRFTGSWSGSGGDLYMNLPFTSHSTGGCVGGGTCPEWNTNSNSVGGVFVKVDNNESIARFTFHNNDGNNNTNPFTSGYLNNSRYLKFSYTYYTHL